MGIKINEGPGGEETMNLVIVWKPEKKEKKKNPQEKPPFFFLSLFQMASLSDLIILLLTFFHPVGGLVYLTKLN